MPDQSPIDLETLEHVLGIGGAKLLRDLAGMLFEAAPARLAAARAALATGDLDTLHRETHALRSGAAHLGAHQVAETTTAIAQQIKTGQTEDLGHLLDLLEEQYAAAKKELEQYLKSSVASGDTDKSRPAAPETPAPARPTVALIEDNADSRLLVRLILQDSYQVVEYAGGKNIPGKLAANLPALVLLDISLPEMDGLEILRLLRADPKLVGLPVVAITAHAMAGDREQFIEAGFDAYVAKPIDDQLLTRTIARLLNN